ncbi:MAG TPA: MEKHLA domain-containing protein [Gallionella sp.]|nr:MEKHLA domain-containing protein [Gallionella sp.]
MGNANATPFLIRHVEILRSSYRHWTGRALIDEDIDGERAVTVLGEAPYAVVSHGTEREPIFNYGNRLALQLFGMSWDEFTALPSRLSAEAPNQAERASLLAAVTRQGYIDNYAGIRIARSGRRFMIKDATIWNLLTPQGEYCGQAALIRQWEML